MLLEEKITGSEEMDRLIALSLDGVTWVGFKGKIYRRERKNDPSGIHCRDPHAALVLLIGCYSCYGAVVTKSLSRPNFYGLKREVVPHPGRC